MIIVDIIIVIIIGFVIYGIIEWITPFPLITNDAKCSCPEGASRCGSSEPKCCPVEGGVCCGDGQHCCPPGYHCDLTHKECVSDDNVNKAPAMAMFDLYECMEG